MKNNIEFVKETLKKLIASNQNRLLNSYNSREKIKNQLDQGELPDDYRVEFIIESSWRVIDLLEIIAKEFNEQHPNDLCSVHDFLDILATTMNKLKQATDKYAEDT